MTGNSLAKIVKAYRSLLLPMYSWHCFCCWYCPSVHEVCPNYEVVDFQPQTLTTMELGSLSHFYIHLLNPTHPPLLPSDVLSPQLSYSVLIPHGIICPSGRHLSPSKHTKKTLSPYLPSPVTTRERLFLSSLAITTPDGFLSPPLPRCCQNLF